MPAIASTRNSSRRGGSGSPVVVAFAEQALTMRRHGLDAAVRHAAARATVDWFAATVAGSVMPPALALSAALADESGGACRLVGDGRRTNCRTAALVNGTAAHSVEMDDIFREGIYHPGAPTIAAALAVAERQHASGEALLRAVTVGYEIGDRVAAAVNPAHYRYWHTTGTVGTLGAAAAVSELLQLDVERFAHAIATAATMAAGLQQAFRSDSMSKPLHAGHAAEAGVLAALAAAEGFTGALDILEGPVGFGVAMAGDPDWDAAIVAMCGEPAITQATVKNHACCGHTFAAVDAALELRARGVRAQDIAEITVETYTTATTVAGNTDPRTAFEAKFSTGYCVAAALLTGAVRLRTFEDSVLFDPAVRELTGRVTLVPDEGMEAAFPGQRAARVTVIEQSGVTHVAERRTRKGDPDDPLTDGELSDKFTDLASPVLGDPGADQLQAAVWHLADVVDVSTLPLAAPDGADHRGGS
ncbi:MAG TPA: MmgE/PrpD family protein [Candidatus Saccharimonadales bacterium]|nr:MmgE/PrpD family protein [Candidatus Saccharimonadales bacterium]